VNLTRNTDLIDLVPSEFYLSQNYPNPFREKTTIKFCLPYRTKVRLQVFNSEGGMVRTLLDEEKEAGSYELEFSAEDRETDGLPAGAPSPSERIYIYRLQAGDFSETKRMTAISPPSQCAGRTTGEDAMPRRRVPLAATLALLAVGSGAISVFAQETATVSGSVRDAQTGEPLPGARETIAVVGRPGATAVYSEGVSELWSDNFVEGRTR